MDPSTTISVFIGFWLLLVLFSMMTSMMYCCSFCWQRTQPRRPNLALQVNRKLDRSTSFIGELLEKLLPTLPYPKPEWKKKKRRSKRKFEMKNGWRRKLKVKRKHWERELHNCDHSNHIPYSHPQQVISPETDPSSNETLKCPSPPLRESNMTEIIPQLQIPCECHARHPYTSSEPHSEQLVLQLPIQAMDNQIDEFCNMVLC